MTRHGDLPPGTRVARTPRGQPWQPALILAGVLAVSLCHYLTPPAHAHWHMVYQRLYYLPILFAAFWYGLRGGLVTAGITEQAGSQISFGEFLKVGLPVTYLTLIVGFLWLIIRFVVLGN